MLEKRHLLMNICCLHQLNEKIHQEKKFRIVDVSQLLLYFVIPFNKPPFRLLFRFVSLENEQKVNVESWLYNDNF